MLIIGITGPTGSGKTTALRALTDLGAEVIDCDALYHELTESCAPMLAELRSCFGDGVFDENGALQRKALGRVVFEDPSALSALNAITHRYIASAVDKRLARARSEGRRAAAVDAIALLDTDLADKCGLTVAVTAPDELRLRWIMARDGISEDYARARMAAQKPSAWFEARCDYVLRNAGNGPEAFYRQAELFFQEKILQGGI